MIPRHLFVNPSRSPIFQSGKFICILLLVLGVLSWASAADRVALVIGNNAYTHAPKLENALRDAKDVAEMLEGKMGFTLVTSGDGKKIWEDVDTETFYDAIAAFQSKSDGAELGLFYFAGHGMEVEKKNFLIPVDAELDRESQLRSQAIELGDVLDDMKKADYPAKLIILDCCRNNPLTRSWTKTRSVGKGLAEIPDTELPSATMIMFSAAPGQPALDGEHGNSPFTAALLRELPKPGVSALDAFFRVSDTVVSDTGKKQEPWVKFDGAGRTFRLFSLVRPEEGTLSPSPAKVVMSKPSIAPESNSSSREKGIRIAVADMQRGLDEFPKTLVEVERINRLANRRQSEIEEAQRAGKQDEVSRLTRDAQVEITAARREMEDELVSDLMAALRTSQKGKGIDLVLDRSYLPKGNKWILFVSENVADVTSHMLANAKNTESDGVRQKPVSALLESQTDELRIGIVSMQACLNDYWRTGVEVEKINKLADRLRSELDSMAAKGENTTNREREASAEVLKSRQDMEVDLVGALRASVNQISQRFKLDLVFDISFLPKGNKALLFSSNKVADLTEHVIHDVNSNAPGGSSGNRPTPPTIGSGKDLQIALVDLEDCMNRFWKTNSEVEKLNRLSEEYRKEFVESTASAKIEEAKSKMTETLVSDIKEAISDLSVQMGIDLVIDQSFLPKARKAVLDYSDRTKTLTDQVVAQLNSGRP